MRPTSPVWKSTSTAGSDKSESVLNGLAKGRRGSAPFFVQRPSSWVVSFAVESATRSGRESRLGEFHPEALAEPDRTLSRHPAPIMEPRYVPTASEQTTLDDDARGSRSSA